MTRQFNPVDAGLNPKAVQELYNIVLTQKLVLEAKLERIKNELAVGACAVNDGVATKEQAAQGMLNLICYIEAKVKVEDELDVEQGSIDLVNKHHEWVKEHYAKNKKTD